MLLTLRLPVLGLSKPPGAVVTVSFCATTLPAAEVAFVRRTRPRMPRGGMVPPNGASPPMPIAPPAIPAKTIDGSVGWTRMLEMLRPLKTGALTATLEALL